MKKNILVCYFLLCIANSSNAQQIEFQQSYQVPGSYDGLCVQQIPPGCAISEIGELPGYIIITNSYALIRTDLYGNIIWSKQFTYPNGGLSDYVEVTSDCGFLIAGSVIDSTSHRNYNLIKTDQDGNLQWSKQYAPPPNDSLFNNIYDDLDAPSWGKIGVKARQTDDNGYIMLGQLNSKTSGLRYFQLIKTNDTGNVEWTKQYDANEIYGGSYNGLGLVYDIDLADSEATKGFILVGDAVDTSKTNAYIVLIRIDSSGTILWSKKYLEPHIYAPQLNGTAVKETKDKGFIVTGGANWALSFKTDSMGDTQWFKWYIIACSDEAGALLQGNTVKQTDDGGYIIGCSHSESGTYEAILIKADSMGNVQWGRGYPRWGFPLEDDNIAGEACSVIQCSDTGYAFTGFVDYPYQSVFFVKTDVNGFAACSDTLWGFCQQEDDTVSVYSIGDTINASVANLTINQTTTTPTITSSILCSLTTGVNEKVEQDTITFFPNPVTSQLTIRTSLQNKSTTISIINTLGQLLYQSAITNPQSEIDVSNLSAGVYFLQLQSESGNAVKMFVKE